MEASSESETAPVEWSSSPSGRPKPAAAVVLAAGLVAGLTAWGAGEALYEFFRPATRQVAVMGGGGSPVADGPAVSKAGSKNGALIYGISGACLGLFLALAGGRGSARSLVKVGGAGLLIGGVVGGVAGYCLASLYWSVWFGTRSGLFDADALLFPLLIKSGLCAAIGAAGGLSFGLARGDDRGALARQAAAGLVGGVLGAVGFELCAAIFFSHVRSMHPIPPIIAGRFLDRVIPPMLVSAVLLFASNRKAS